MQSKSNDDSVKRERVERGKEGSKEQRHKKEKERGLEYRGKAPWIFVQ